MVIESVALIEIDVVDGEASQRLVEFLMEMLAGEAAVVGGRKRPVRLVGPEGLGGKYESLASEGLSACPTTVSVSPEP